MGLSEKSFLDKWTKLKCPETTKNHQNSHIFVVKFSSKKQQKNRRFTGLGVAGGEKKVKIDAKPSGNHFSNGILTTQHILGGLVA